MEAVDASWRLQPAFKIHFYLISVDHRIASELLLRLCQMILTGDNNRRRHDYPDDNERRIPGNVYLGLFYRFLSDGR